MTPLDRTEQRIVGVLIEKQMSVPDSYPLSENALVDGCNQKSNRDPVTELESFQVAGALMALQDKGCVARVEGGGRVPKFRHRLAEELHVDDKALAVFAELLLRGPQAPGALKPRVQRMGLHASPEEIELLLQSLAQRSPPLAEQLPLRPRERDRRWRHLLGDASEQAVVADQPAADEAGSPAVGASELERCVAELEQQVAALQATVRQLAAEAGEQSD
jgi:hypothetical protein